MVATGQAGVPTVLAAATAVVLPVAGVLLLQTAYRDGGLDAGLATQTAIDPSVAAAIGIVLLGERFSGGAPGAALALLSAGVVVVALVALIRASPTPSPAELVARVG